VRDVGGGLDGEKQKHFLLFSIRRWGRAALSESDSAIGCCLIGYCLNIWLDAALCPCYPLCLCYPYEAEFSTNQRGVVFRHLS
jgi:hypothetical protein